MGSSGSGPWACGMGSSVSGPGPALQHGLKCEWGLAAWAQVRVGALSILLGARGLRQGPLSDLARSKGPAAWALGVAARGLQHGHSE